MYLLIVSIVMAAFGGANLLFAFVDPPAALGAMFDGASRRIRFIVSFLPEARQTTAARLLTGLVFVLGSAVAGAAWLRTQG